MHVDEIGLTSDKYVPLNRTLSSLPLKISIEPMSLQRWQLMQVSRHVCVVSAGVLIVKAFEPSVREPADRR